jgi:SAM-dependent methyltransferase
VLGESAGEHGDYLAPYREVVRRIGPRFEALLWNSPETQQKRFEAIAAMVDLTQRVVVDAGCGRGDFGAFLRDRKVAYGRYVGVDAVSELLDVARGLDLPNAGFVEGDFVSDPGVFAEAARREGAPARAADVIVFSGSLNTLPQPRAEGVLQHAWDACGEALAFNFLSDRSHRSKKEEIGPARRFNTVGLVKWALKRTALVRFRQDSLKGNDATIVMLKDRS